MDEKKQTGLIITIVTLLLCGCPAACMFFFGLGFSAGEPTFWTLPVSPDTVGLSLICLSLIAGLIPVGVGAYYFWPKKKAGDIDELEGPLPPAI
ncbi:MAG: hypothetical protein N2D54_08880 [Chloroflexota bacterium]